MYLPHLAQAAHMVARDDIRCGRRDWPATRPTRVPAEAHVGPVFVGLRAGHRAGQHTDRASSGAEMTVRDQAEAAYRSMIDAGYGTSMAMRAYQTKMTTLPGVRIDGMAVRLLRPSSRWSHTRMAEENYELTDGLGALPGRGRLHLSQLGDAPGYQQIVTAKKRMNCR